MDLPILNHLVRLSDICILNAPNLLSWEPVVQ